MCRAHGHGQGQSSSCHPFHLHLSQSEVGAVYTIVSPAVGPRGRSHLLSVLAEQVLQPRVDSGSGSVAELPLCCSLVLNEASLAPGAGAARASEPFLVQL